MASPTPPPYTLVDNVETLLAVSDLVFIDPMSTGHSRAVEGGKAKDYHGFAKDVEQVAELIRLWCTREDRWMSPKYLIGESYGTVRAVAVAERLSSKHAMAFNGIVLVSSVLDFGSQDFEFLRADEACLNFLPTYAAIAHFHGLHPDRTLEEVRAEAEEFAPGPIGSRARPRPPAAGRRARRGGCHAGPADRAQGGVRRPHRAADRALALVHRGAARPRADRRGASTVGSPARCTPASPRTWTPTRPATRSRRRSRPPSTLPARRARQHPRPALRGVRQLHQGVVLQGVRGQADQRHRQARAADARQPTPAGADRVRLLRPRHALPRRRGHGRPPASARPRRSTASSTSTSRPATCRTWRRAHASAKPKPSPPS